jgi:hypothetical protein
MHGRVAVDCGWRPLQRSLTGQPCVHPVLHRTFSGPQRLERVPPQTAWDLGGSRPARHRCHTWPNRLPLKAGSQQARRQRRLLSQHGIWHTTTCKRINYIKLRDKLGTARQIASLKIIWSIQKVTMFYCISFNRLNVSQLTFIHRFVHHENLFLKKESNGTKLRNLPRLHEVTPFGILLWMLQ